ncbi:unnamed protein product [Prunus armeniaca]
MAMKRDQPDLEKRLCGVCGSTERWFLHYGPPQRTFSSCASGALPSLTLPASQPIPPSAASSALPAPSPPSSFFNLTRQNDGQDAKTTVVIDKDAAKALVARRQDRSGFDDQSCRPPPGLTPSAGSRKPSWRKRRPERPWNDSRLLSIRKRRRIRRVEALFRRLRASTRSPNWRVLGQFKWCPKISEPEGSNGLKTSHADPMEED